MRHAVPVDASDRRVTQAARDAAAEQLSAAYVAGAYSTDTFEANLAVVLSARTRAELDRMVRPSRAGGDATTELFVTRSEESLLLGRSSSCERVFDDEEVSRRHALLRRGADGGWRLVDLESTNGTWLNGRRVERSTPVSDGDELRLAGLRLTVRLPG